MRYWQTFLVVLVATIVPRGVSAVSIPILDPGFDIYTANTLNLVPDDALPNLGSPGAGSGPLQNFLLLNFDTFGLLGSGDIPAGWTATGQKPNGTANTTRVRCDECFLSPTGTVASINSFHDENDPATQGRFFQTLTGVPVQPNTRYTATIEVSDMDIYGRGPFALLEDNVVLGDPTRIVLSLSAVASPTEFVDLGGALEFTDITPGGFGTAEAPVSGGKSLLKLTVETGATVPVGDLQISFAAGGSLGELPGSFAASAQTFFDNVTLDATPLTVALEGDFNGNGTVDAADYVVWRHGTFLATAYNAWLANFGNSSMAAKGTGGTGSAASVPEPAGLIAILLGGCITAATRSRLSRVARTR